MKLSISVSTIKRAQRLMPKGKPRYLRCYDNGGKTLDRYIVVYTRIADGLYLCCNSDPCHPQGIGMHGEGVIDRPKYSHLGKRIDFLDLPPKVQEYVEREYREVWKIPYIPSLDF